MKFKNLILFTFITFSLVSCASSRKAESTGQYLDSATITAKVKAQLIQSHRLKAFDIQVATFKNRVQLSGFVNTEEEKELALKIALKVNGVESVTNSIIVK